MRASYPKLLAVLLPAVLAVFPGSVHSAGAGPPRLPFSLSPADWRPLEQCGDQSLQKRLDRALRQHPLWQSLIDEKKMAVGLVDLSDWRLPRFARVNGNTMMYAASLPKIAILLAAFQGFDRGTRRQTPEVRADLIEMIRRSDNAAANRLIDRIGLRQIEAVLFRYRFYDRHRGGGIWLGSAYGRAGEQRPEPLQDLLHAATVTQVCRFYYLLAYGRLINPECSRQMLKILAFPDLEDKFFRVLKGKVPLWHLYRKSGGWKIWQSDSILVWGETGRRYILVALVEHRQGEQILRELVPAVEHLLQPHPQFR
jgi:beta-lactamase class A